MLLFALFTLGYLSGVFMALKFFVGKEEFENYPKVDYPDITQYYPSSNAWENFTQLTRVNTVRSQKDIALPNDLKNPAATIAS